MNENDIIIDVDGVRYDGWTDIVVSKSLENLTGKFRFTSTASKENEFPVKLGQRCKIFVNRILFLTGWIEKIIVDLSARHHSITIAGRDITNDVVDSQLDHVDFNPPTSLKSMTEKILSILNSSDIKVINNFKLKNFDDVETDSFGITAFDFLESYAKKSQVLLTTNGDGDIEFIRAGTEQFNTVLSTAQSAIGTILATTVEYDDTKRFNKYVCRGQENVGSNALFDKKINPVAVSNVEGGITDDEIRTSRQYFFQPEQNGESTDNTERAKWEANYRKSKGMIYNVTVQGFKPLEDDGIWELNKLVQVVDDFSNISDTKSILLISEIEFTENLQDGTKTRLKLIDKKSFTTIVNKPTKDSRDFVQGQQKLFDRQKQPGATNK
jgi:prophage tail gpP-like protein